MTNERLQFGSVHSGDFRDNTLVIEMEENVIIQGGRVAIVRVDSPEEAEKLNEFLNQNN